MDENKVFALAKHLDILPAFIKEDYENCYVVNPRTAKKGRSPEWYKQTIADLRSLLDEKTQDLITECIIDRKFGNELNEAYDKVSKKLSANKNEVYEKLKADNMYVENILYFLIKEAYSSDTVHGRSLRRAWLGMSIEDTRNDVPVNDGEYLVLTKEESEQYEEEHLRSYFQVMVYDVNDFAKKYLDEDRYVNEYKGKQRQNLASYDGEEHTEEFEGVTYYIYRVN